jgi:DNA-binding ferritin-like protein
VHQASRAVAQVFGAPPEIEYAFTDEHQLFALYSVLIGGMAEDPKYPMRSPGAAQLYVSLARYPGSYEPPAPLEQQDFGYFTLSRYAKENPKRKKGTQARKNRWWGKPAKQPRSKAKGRFKVKFELWEATRQGDPSSLAPSMRDTIEFDTPDAFARWYSNLASHPDAMLRIKRAALDGKDIDPKVVLGVAANNNPTNPRYFVRDLDDPDWGLVLDADNAAAAMVEARERTGKRRGRFEVYARFVGGEPVRFNPKYPMGAAQMRQKLAELDKLYEYGEIDDATYHRLRSEMAYASQRGTGPGHALAALERKVAARPAQRWPSESYIPRLQREDLERPGGHRHRVVTSLLAAGRWERALRILEKLDGRRKWVKEAKREANRLRIRAKKALRKPPKITGPHRREIERLRAEQLREQAEGWVPAEDEPHMGWYTEQEREDPFGVALMLPEGDPSREGLHPKAMDNPGAIYQPPDILPMRIQGQVYQPPEFDLGRGRVILDPYTPELWDGGSDTAPLSLGIEPHQPGDFIELVGSPLYKVSGTWDGQRFEGYLATAHPPELFHADGPLPPWVQEIVDRTPHHLMAIRNSDFMERRTRLDAINQLAHLAMFMQLDVATFESRKWGGQMVDALAAAGYPELANMVNEGLIPPGEAIDSLYLDDPEFARAYTQASEAALGIAPRGIVEKGPWAGANPKRRRKSRAKNNPRKAKKNPPVSRGWPQRVGVWELGHVVSSDEAVYGTGALHEGWLARVKRHSMWDVALLGGSGHAPGGLGGDPVFGRSYGTKEEALREGLREDRVRKELLAPIGGLVARVAKPRSNPRQSDVGMYQDILAHLRALQWVYTTSHWTSAGPNSYSDHLLLQRLYEGLDKPIDALGERMVAYFGPQSVDPGVINGKAQQLVEEASTEFAHLPDGSRSDAAGLLAAEKSLQRHIRAAWKANQDSGDEMSLGIDDYLMGLANERDEAIYLLKQRLKA